ncbi:RNA polymerase sigma factor [Chitinophaga sp. S165]|uniref:RNA polymerase sigma factor n=1 Tax=Chitinophaga sp. S165 TaxID=2135462 RepID=UPI000D71A8A7|nr:sigma-70 family RNA polymerase sigma factor [Chitinophaga sp. S165]PWV47089.1 RNA polymerase sigma-70 factor (ECF subfamily) [Chitinophaga sp. S165]
MPNEQTILINSLLLQQLQAGEQSAYRQLYELTWKPLLNAAYKRLGLQQEAEEVVQDVFTSLYERRQELTIAPGKLFGYLQRAVQFRCYDIYRQWSAQRKLHLIPGLTDVDYAVAPDYLSEIKELSTQIDAVIAGLPERCRQAFRLSRFEQLTNKQIAERMGISVGVVEKLMSRALRELRVHFSDYELLWMGSWVLYQLYQ